MSLAPGRGFLELSVLLSAAAILVPLCCPGAVVAAVAARRAGNRRWLAAVLAAVWCGLLGIFLRGIVGMGIAP